ncbi:MAG TPA: hypothetical protein VLI05_00460 [Candidatus Saccharimonadia bacterium]|nr:hypothetical protein [Candidatus Saccharimonadia bacterium]
MYNRGGGRSGRPLTDPTDLEVVRLPDWLWSVIAWVLWIALGVGVTWLAYRAWQHWRPGRRWVRLVMRPVVALVVAITLVLAGWGVDSGLGAAQGLGEQASITWHTATNPNAKSQVVAVWAPGLGNSGDITATSYLDTLELFGPVAVVNYPQHSFDLQQIARQIADHIMITGLRPLFIGQSLGSVVLVQVLRLYLAAGQPNGKVAGFVSVSGPNDASDVTWPIPPDVAHKVPGGPITNPVIAAYLNYRDAHDAIQGGLPHGSSETLYQQHRSYLDNFPYVGSMAQIRGLQAAVGAHPDEFAGIPALLLHVEGNDVLINWPQAIGKLTAAFSGAAVTTVPGIHANVVEYDMDYRTVITGWVGSHITRG